MTRRECLKFAGNPGNLLPCVHFHCVVSHGSQRRPGPVGHRNQAAGAAVTFCRGQDFHTGSGSGHRDDQQVGGRRRQQRRTGQLHLHVHAVRACFPCCGGCSVGTGSHAQDQDPSGVGQACHARVSTLKQHCHPVKIIRNQLQVLYKAGGVHTGSFVMSFLAASQAAPSRSNR